MSQREMQKLGLMLYLLPWLQMRQRDNEGGGGGDDARPPSDAYSCYDPTDPPVRFRERPRTQVSILLIIHSFSMCSVVLFYSSVKSFSLH